MRIKICGLNPIRDVQLCIDLKVNYLGFVFYEKSPRNISLQEIKNLSNYDKKESSFVAVTVVAGASHTVCSFWWYLGKEIMIDGKKMKRRKWKRIRSYNVF